MYEQSKKWLRNVNKGRKIRILELQGNKGRFINSEKNNMICVSH